MSERLNSDADVNITDAYEHQLDLPKQKANLDFGDAGLTYGKLAEVNAAAIMNATQAFAQMRIEENLTLLDGQWRDTSYGIGGGRVPTDANAALAPAALRSIKRTFEHPAASSWRAHDGMW
ncbi:hypothetical protein AC579_4374 [Pseudocercospora musae]|uniref:Uncharacterized protein n=1 Tax=Pseudocercospora musae TaxID=113226 RepID=A0A139IQT2_9PEZI|nr:hypothetical protein AC579_4374 [Pseudocercospora musae]